MLELLRRRDFALLWAGGLISIAGDWVLYAALPFFVYERTGSTIAAAGIIAAELVPGALLGTVAGVFLDRWDRKRVLVAGSLVQAAIVCLLLPVSGGAGIWLVYVVAAATATAGAFTVPAENALLPTLVGERELLTANALAALNNRLARVLGLFAGGALLGAVGLDAVVLVDAASFVLAATLIALIAAPAREPRLEPDAASVLRRFRAEWAGGMRLVRRDRTIGVLFGVLGLMTFGGTMLDPLSAAWVRDVLQEGPEVFAWLMAVHSASGIVGTLLVGRLGNRVQARTLMGWGSIVAGGLLALRFNVPLVALAFVLAVPNGITSVASSVGVQTVIQQSVRDEYRGRVFGALGASGSLLSLAGALVGGWLGELAGVVPALNFASGLVAISGLVVLLALPGGARRPRPVSARPRSTRS